MSRCDLELNARSFKISVAGKYRKNYPADHVVVK